MRYFEPPKQIITTTKAENDIENEEPALTQHQSKQNQYSIQCKSCGLAYFCSENCHSLSVEHFKLNTTSVCEQVLKPLYSLTRKHNKDIISIVSIVVQLLLKSIEEQKNSLKTENEKSQNQQTEFTVLQLFEMLVSHEDKWQPEDTLFWKKVVKSFLKTTSILFWNNPQNSDHDEKKEIDATLKCWREEKFILNLISKIESNGFGMWPSKGNQCYGRLFCPSASFFNHSCDPNCSVVIRGNHHCYSFVCMFYFFYENLGTVIEIITNRKVQKDGELTIGYISLNFPRSARFVSFFRFCFLFFV
jgi:radical SAM protein with 4Fe4S-binding SPASM domain